jgi:hypothetical protein
MLTPDERFEIGMKFLQRLKSAEKTVTGQKSRLNGGRLSPFPHSDAGLKPAAMEAEFSQSGEPGQENNFDRIPSLSEILDQTGPLPSNSVILGVCEDGLPFLFDLTNPAPGSLLIVGDEGSGKTRLVKSVLASAMQLSKPNQLAFSIITPNPSQFQDEMLSTEFCQHFLGADETSAVKLIENMAQLAEDRRRSSTPGQMLLLIIDDLAACLQPLDDEHFRRLYWLIKHGPRSRIWILATIDPSSLAWMDERILDAFRTRLMGTIADPELASALAGDEAFNAGDLEEGSQFCVPFGEDWIRFWICDPP